MPFAEKQLLIKILDLCKEAVEYKQLRKGANEATKFVNRGKAELVIITSDADPLEIVLHFPIICEDKNVPYVFIPSSKILGESCKISRPIIACVIVKQEGSPLNQKIEDLKTEIESNV
ncbi:nhp2-like protein [Anaeramoeba flamelloides]|nr:nhp2-like protein [Anaeramoeba flamelloides]KAJ6233580.1 nhp2-like protein [Anaeramoeba flamelloides]